MKTYYAGYNYDSLTNSSIYNANYGSQTIAVDLLKVLFSNNQYIGNYAGKGKSLIYVAGVFRIYFEDEYFYSNGENSLEVTQMLQSLTGSTYQMVTVNAAKDTLASTFSYDVSSTYNVQNGAIDMTSTLRAPIYV